MYNDEKKFTRLTVENSYGHKITVDWDHEDVDMEDLLNAFYASLIGLTWQPETVLRNMRDFADERLALYDKEKKDEEDYE